MAMTKSPFNDAKKLVDQFDRGFIELADLLWRLNDTEPEKFNELIEKNVIGRRKAYYLVSMAKALQPLNIPRDRLVDIGWTKLQIISPHINAQNADDLLTAAETMKARDLDKHVRGEKTSTKEQHAVLLYFDPKDYEDFKTAVLSEGAQKSGRGLINKEEAVMRIIQRAIKGELGGKQT